MKRVSTPVPGGFSSYVCTIGVDNLDETIRRVEEHKGKCVRPKQAVPGIGWHCHCMDTEGNVFGLMQHDPKAA
jgi:predicted enzyme related to lactoylglutathione lyase